MTHPTARPSAHICVSQLQRALTQGYHNVQSRERAKPTLFVLSARRRPTDVLKWNHVSARLALLRRACVQMFLLKPVDPREKTEVPAVETSARRYFPLDMIRHLRQRAAVFWCHLMSRSNDRSDFASGQSRQQPCGGCTSIGATTRRNSRGNSCVAWLRGMGVVSLVAAPAAQADLDTGKLQIHGFASQSVVQTSSNWFFGDSPNTSFDYTEVGLNASARVQPKVLFAAQVLARRAGEMYDGDPSLDYALADIAVTATPARILGVRLGRVKNPLGLYNETRDVPFTRPGIFLPQVVYFDKVRNLALSSDGIAFYASTYHDFGELSLTLGGGWPVIDDNVKWTYLGGHFSGALKSDDLLWTGSLWYTSLTEQLRVGLSGVIIAMRYLPGAGAVLAPGTTDLDYWIASVQYNAQRWTLSAEFMREPVRWHGYTPFLSGSKVTVEGYYLQGVYRIRPNLEFMACYEEGFANRYDRDGTLGAIASAGLWPPNTGFSKIWTTGLRWDVTPNVMLRAQYQWNSGTFVLSNRENPDLAGRREYWTLMALQIAFRF